MRKREAHVHALEHVTAELGEQVTLWEQWRVNTPPMRG